MTERDRELAEKLFIAKMAAGHFDQNNPAIDKAQMESCFHWAKRWRDVEAEMIQNDRTQNARTK